MTQQNKLRYEDFWDSINVDAFEEAIGFSPEYEHNGNDVGYCVFPQNHAHGDTTGKFAIEREMRVYNCWACGGGSLLSLAMELYNFDVDEATHWLYQFCEADARSDAEFVDDFLDAFHDVERRVATLPYFNDRVLERFSWSETMPVALADWAVSRNIDALALSAYNVGYGELIRRPAPTKGRFAEAEDYTGPGIVLPHYWNGRLVGWQTRWLDENRPEWIPKYTNTGDFPKETTIYGWDKVQTSEAVIVVESVPTVLFLASCGYAAVATFGSNVNDAQMRLLRRFPLVVLAADNDKPSKENGTPAGIKWRQSLTDYLKNYTQVMWTPLVGRKGSGSDLNDLDHSELELNLSQMYDPLIDSISD